MEKAQGDNAAVILDATNQAAATTKDHIAGPDFTFNNHLGKRLCAANGGNFGAVYIAQRQVKQQVLNAVKAQFLQLCCQLGPTPRNWLTARLCRAVVAIS